MPSVPLLVPDACALLDVLRGAIGIRSQATSVVPFQRLVAAARAGKVEFALPGPSLSGYSRNVDRVTTEVVGHGRRVLEGMSLLTAGHAALPDAERLILPGLPPMGVAESWARDLAEAWSRSIHVEIDSWKVVNSTQEDIDFARARMAGGLAPCSHGGAGFEDAEIISCALRLADAHSGTAVFISSNTSDFCDTGTTGIHAELKEVFSTAGLDLATSWGAAVGLTGI